MRCPYCNHTETKVVDTREAGDLDSTRRRRECLKCTKRFTTYERIETVDLTIIKKDGRREQFDRGKLILGVLKACEKRPIARERIEQIADQVESEIRSLDGIEVPSSTIGQLVMRKLKKLDKVAYIRFASVYRSFADLSSFEAELHKLLKGGKNA